MIADKMQDELYFSGDGIPGYAIRRTNYEHVPNGLV